MAKKNNPAANKTIEQLEAEHKEFLVAFALAILSWQHIESKLFEIFRLLIRGKDFRATSAAYHSIVNLKAKVDATSNAAKFALEDDESMLNNWKRIAKRITTNARNRNLLAHSTLTYYRDISAVKANVPLNTIYLRADFSNALADMRNEIDLKRIKSFQESFMNLSIDMIGFSNALWDKFGHDIPDLARK